MGHSVLLLSDILRAVSYYGLRDIIKQGQPCDGMSGRELHFILEFGAEHPEVKDNEDVSQSNTLRISCLQRNGNITLGQEVCIYMDIYIISMRKSRKINKPIP